MDSLIRYFAKQGIFSNLMTVFVFLFGTFALLNIKREVFPNVSYDVLTVTTIYPGASPEEVEKFVTNPLEQAIKEVDGIKKLLSTSSEGISAITLQLDPNTTTESKAKEDVREVIDAITDLPDDIEEPKILAIESKLQPVVEVSLAGAVDEMTLRKIAIELERKLEAIREVAKVNINGKRDIEYWIEADPKKLQQYRLTLQSLSLALRGQNINVPGGSIEITDPGTQFIEEFIVRTMGEFSSVDDVLNTVITANPLGQPIRVRDVARVRQTFEKKQSSYRTNGNPAMNLVVLKKENADAIRLVQNVRAVTEEFKSELKEPIEISFVNDFSRYVTRRLSVLSSNMLVGLVLVLIVLSLVLPFRVAMIAAFGIPFSFLGAMMYFQFADVSLNLITMIGLIIVVGMLVDDAIVVTENTQRLRDEGLDKMEAAIQGAATIWRPVTVSVLTTVMAFAPMMFMSGIFGKFIAAIPIGVISALLISLWEVFFILPHHLAAWTSDTGGRSSDAGVVARFWDSKVVVTYVTWLRNILRFRYLVLLGTLCFFVGSLVFAQKYMKIILFPPGGIEAFMITFEAEDGTPIQQTERLVAPIEEALKELPKDEVLDFVFSFGRIQAAPDRPTQGIGGQYGMAFVYLSAATERERSAQDIIEIVRERVGQVPGLKKIIFAQMQGGPPVGKPVNVNILGEDYKDLRAAAELLEEKLKTIPGVSDLENSYILGKRELRLKANPIELAASQLSLGEVGRTVRAAFEGVVETSVRTLDEEIQLRVLLQDKDRKSIDSIDQIEIPNTRGNLIPLKRVVNAEQDRGVAVHTHDFNRRLISVSGEIDTNLNSALGVTKTLQEFVKENREKFQRVTIEFGGENEDTAESLESLKRAFGFAFFGIFFIMVLLFQNILQPIVIVSSIPLGILSVIWALYFNNSPISFLGMLGIIALSGVIVNNAIVFVDFVNQRRIQGADRFQSILDAGKSRLKPIFLTTITTSAGILPTAYGIGGSDPFVVPIALALGWGVLFGAFLTALILPAVLGIVDDVEWIFRRVKQLLFPSSN